MYEKLDNCPACKHHEFTNEIIVTDHAVSNESFALTKCTKCQLLFTNPRPIPANISRYYENENYISHTNKANNLINLVYKYVRTITLKSKCNLISKYSDTGNLLDYGCGTGHFLKAAQDRGWTVQGLEPDQQARSIAEKEVGHTLCDSLDSLPSKDQYDIITAWHVIEHVHDLRDTIKKLKKKLKDDGTLFIALPNHQSYDAKHYQDLWAGYDVPRHLYHFSKQSFSYLATKSRLTLLDTVPMKFDSFYVSMLSEKYNSHHGSLLKAFNVGLKSNRLAKSTGNYSSLIYVLKK